MRIGISIATYFRQNGQTKELLRRCLESIKNQTHQDYVVFLIGDKYDYPVEFFELATSIIPHDKIVYDNLDVAVEREKYHNNKQALWSCGGCNARNYANTIAKNYVEYCCQLDDDDYFLENHLSSINSVIENTNNPAFIHTLSNHMGTNGFPNLGVDGSIIEHYPEPCNITHSSTCFNLFKIPLQYRDVYAETGQTYPADADMWSRVTEYCRNNKMVSYCIKTITCVHESEKSVLG